MGRQNRRFSRPANEADFESWCAIICREMYDTNDLRKFGRRGQKQDGIDLLGSLPDGKVIGIQCKMRNDRPLTLNDIKTDLDKLNAFELPISRFVYATTSSRNTQLHQFVIARNQESKRGRKCQLEILFWEDIEEWLSCHGDLVLKISDAQIEYDDLAHVRLRRGARVTGGTFGYFNSFLNLVEQNTASEHVKVFASLPPFEVRKKFRGFGPARLFERLPAAVERGQLTIEYTVLLTSKRMALETNAKSLLDEYLKFASEVRVIYRDKMTVPTVDTERTIALMSKRRCAFTHGWDVDGSITVPTRWTLPTDYKLLLERYERLKQDSRTYPARTQKRRFS